MDRNCGCVNVGKRLMKDDYFATKKNLTILKSPPPSS